MKGAEPAARQRGRGLEWVLLSRVVAAGPGCVFCWAACKLLLDQGPRLLALLRDAGVAACVTVPGS